jgi:hypothetical protein
VRLFEICRTLSVHNLSIRTFSVLILLHIEEYATVNAIAEGRLTYVFKKGIISAPELGAVTTRTS